MKCIKCGIKLLREKNWFPSQKLTYNYRCKNCHRKYCLDWRKKNRQALNYHIKIYREDRKMEVFRHYSPTLTCQSCGEKNLKVLTLDHIKGGGTNHRKSIKKWSGFETYQWARNNDYPKIFQVLCFNCQFRKRSIDMECGQVDTYWSKYRSNLRWDIISHYSPYVKCSNCGLRDINVLTIHHVEGNGRKHLKSLGGSLSFYRWIKENNYPPEFQILCMNCNYIKG